MITHVGQLLVSKCNCVWEVVLDRAEDGGTESGHCRFRCKHIKGRCKFACEGGVWNWDEDGTWTNGSPEVHFHFKRAIVP